MSVCCNYECIESAAAAAAASPRTVFVFNVSVCSFGCFFSSAFFFKILSSLFICCTVRYVVCSALLCLALSCLASIHFNSLHFTFSLSRFTRSNFIDAISISIHSQNIIPEKLNHGNWKQPSTFVHLYIYQNRVDAQTYIHIYICMHILCECFIFFLCFALLCFAVNCKLSLILCTQSNECY